MLFPLLAQAQTAALPSDWLVIKSLPGGQRVKVELVGRKTVEGAFAGASDNTLTVSRKGRAVELGRSDVARVYQVVPASKVRRTLLGTAIGGGIGITTGALFYSRGDYIKKVIPGMGLIGAGVGAVIGALAGLRHRDALVYAAYPPVAETPRP